MKIPIKESIKSNAWLECVAREEYSEEALPFRIRVKSFQRVNVDSLRALLSRQDSDAAKGLEGILKRDDGILWFLGLEIVSLKKRQVDPTDITEHILLTDHEDYEFNVLHFRDVLRHIDEGAHPTLDGLHRLVYGDEVKPKIRTEGVLTFMLPTDEPDEYYVSCTGGDIKEI